MDDVSVNFIELVALTKITPESTVEKFGSLINSSFFDASNILATLKQKGLVDFVTAFPSQSLLKLTDKGTELIGEVTKRSSELIDQLDLAILTQLANGKRNLVELGGALNVAQMDLAIHIYKLAVQQNITYELVNAAVNMFLTEKGFVAVRTSAQPAPQPMAQQGSPAPMASPTAAAGAEMPSPSGSAGAAAGMDQEIKVLEEISKKRKARRKIMIIMLIVIVIVVVVLAAFVLK